MKPNAKKKYDLTVINKLLKEFEYLPFEEKWQKIADHFNRSYNGTLKWYYRNRERGIVEEVKAKKIKVKYDIDPNDVKTDTIRTIYYLLFQKSCRVPFYHAIEEIREFLDSLFVDNLSNTSNNSNEPK